MKTFQDLRRAGILMKKRFQLFQYNFGLKLKSGQSYDIARDSEMNNQHRSLNLLDFNNNRDRDLFMIDVYSDSTMYGGMTETNLVIQHREDGSCCKALL